jgi:GrpB-like predicted nucleotidyltransferase (UPF0157 family)
LSDTQIIVEYDPAWLRQFEALAAVLAEAMGKLAVQIHHVGSTSIPGMAAKPVLDIDIELARHLLFRDKLRRSAALRSEHLQLKQACLERANGERQVYVDEKERLGTAFFNKVLNPSP